MSLDLYQDEAIGRLSNLPPVEQPPAGVFDGFVRGAAMHTMRGFAKVGRAIDLAGAVGPIAQDAITGGTEAQERYFKEHEEVFQGAVDYWTPKPHEVGAAGEVVGSLLSMIPTVVASPALAVGATGLDTAEELARQGVSSPKAIAAGIAQATGLGLGIWMPILGANGWQRIAVGGAGFNALQGVATRGISAEILEGTPAEGQYHAFDPAAMTLDVLLGAAFGTLAHLSPAQRAQGAEAWKQIQDWAEKLSPSQKDALATLREAQHLNVDSAPGKLESPEAIDAHVTRMRTGMEQVLRDEPVEVSDLPAAKVAPDPERMAEAAKFADELTARSEELREELGLPRIDDQQAPVEPGIRTETPPADSFPPPPPGEDKPAGGSARDPLAMEADRIATERADQIISLGRDPEGNPITTTVRQYLDEARADAAAAREEAKLFEVAAGCYLGRM